MKTLLKIFTAGLMLAAVSCTEKGSEPLVSSKTCGICHSLPPKDAGHLYHVDSLHYKCSYCHSGYAADSVEGTFYVNAATHMNGDTDVVFLFPWSDSGRAAYDIRLKLCSNVYCHGGIPQGTHATVLWGGASINMRCYACHDSVGIMTYHYGHGKVPVYTGLTPHGGTVQQCNKCHDSTYSAPLKTVDPVKHINGVFDIGTCRNCHPPPNGWATWQEYVATHPGATPFGKIMATGTPGSMP